MRHGQQHDREGSMKQQIAGLIAWLTMMGCITPTFAAVDVPICQYLDRGLTPAWQTSLSIIPESDIEEFGATGMVEWDLRGELGYYHNIWLADVDLTVASELTFLTDSTDMALPDTLWALYAEGTWTWRYVGGSSLQLRFAPGIYAATDAISGGSFNMPTTLAGVRRLNETTSGVLGATLRLGFNDWFMPLAGIAWQPSPGFRGEFMLPVTRLIWFPNQTWTFHTGLEWNNTSYRMKSGNGLNHERLTTEDFRLTFGSTYIVNSSFFARFEAGSVFGRRLELDNAPSSSATLSTNPDSTVFFRLSLNGPF
jgi:hypothetical protein